MSDNVRRPPPLSVERMSLDTVLAEAARTIDTLAVANHTGQISIFVEMLNGSVVRAKIAQERVILKHRKQ